MVELGCDWLGLRLANPFVVGASPLCDSADDAVALVDVGASAVVVHSLFEEQLIADQVSANRYLDSMIDTNAEAPSFLPETDVFSGSANPMLRHVRRLTEVLDVPVVASLNGVTPGGWTGYARELAGAGAAAIELNLYDVATDLDETGEDIEERQLSVVADVVGVVDVPVSVKLSPFYASVPNFVTRLEAVGAAGVVLFNRFYQPDLDLETLDIAAPGAVHPGRAPDATTCHGNPARPNPAVARRQRWGPQRNGCGEGDPLGGGRRPARVGAAQRRPISARAHRRRTRGLDGCPGLPQPRRGEGRDGDGQRRQSTRTPTAQLRPAAAQLVALTRPRSEKSPALREGLA